MNCCDAQTRILDRLHHGGGPGDRADELNAHLDSCANCRAWNARQLTIDTALSTQLSPLKPGPAWRAQLQRRIEALPPLLSPDEAAERRRSLEAEFHRSRPRIGSLVTLKRLFVGLSYGLTVFAITVGSKTLATEIYRHADLFGSTAGPALPMTVCLMVAGMGVLSGWIGLSFARRMI